MEEEPYIVTLRIEIMRKLMDAGYLWNGWDDLYKWELKCDKDYEEMKSEILVRACHLLAKVMMRNKKSPEDYVVNEYRNAIKEAKRATKLQLFKKDMQRKVDSLVRDRVIETKYDWNKARKAYYKFKKLTPAGKIRCGNPDCKKRYNLQASQMELHHLMPRSVSPSLTYDPHNMTLICKQCHKLIHKGWDAYWNLKRKINRSTIDLE